MMDREMSAAGARINKLMIVVGLLVVLIGCTPPEPHALDQALPTGGTMEQYRATMDALAEQFTPEEKAAFDWAVADFDLEGLHQVFPDATPRQIIRGQAKRVLGLASERIAELEREAAEQAPVRESLAKIRAENGSFSIGRDFFGLQPHVQFEAVNGSDLPISQMNWEAALYLDGASAPVARTRLYTDFRSAGGLKPGGKMRRRQKVGFVRGDEAWSTLEIRNAASRRVEVVPVISSVRDFGDRYYVTGDDPEATIRELREAEALAKRYESF